MTSQEKAFQAFAQFAANLKGDEKSEAQTFLFHLLEAFGHNPNTLPEGCTFEYRLRIDDLPTRHAALTFLFLRAFQPLFGHNWVEVTREAAKDVANAFNSLEFRGEDRARARRFILQCVVAMFAEDIGLLPQNLFTRLLDECRKGASSYDLIGGLFRQMNEAKQARAGRYV